MSASESRKLRDPASTQEQKRCAAWAAQCLGIANDADAAQLRTEFWRRLQPGAPTPTDEELAALEFLEARARGEPHERVPEEFRWAEDAEACRAVELFARQMFELSPTERRQRWLSLAEQSCATPRAASRRESLIVGLDLDLADIPSTDESGRGLALLLCEMVSSPPARRCDVRRKIRESALKDPVAARRVAKRFRRRYPGFAAIDPTLLDELVAAPTLHRLPYKLPTPRRRHHESKGERRERSWNWGRALLTSAGLLLAFAVVNRLSEQARHGTSRSPEEIQRSVEESLREIRQLNPVPRSEIDRHANEFSWSPSEADETGRDKVPAKTPDDFVQALLQAEKRQRQRLGRSRDAQSNENDGDERAAIFRLAPRE